MVRGSGVYPAYDMPLTYHVISQFEKFRKWNMNQDNEAGNLWSTASMKAKEGWLTHHGFKPGYAKRGWDGVPSFIRYRWESES